MRYALLGAVCLGLAGMAAAQEKAPIAYPSQASFPHENREAVARHLAEGAKSPVPIWRPISTGAA
jgi:metallo-beta-lactamase class B